MIDSFEILPITGRVVEHYARIACRLRETGMLIGANDLWIAATALERGSPLVTRNQTHFARVPDLRTIPY